MRKRRILSLLLAVAVMATMLIAVPLTASANIEESYTYFWVSDFGEPPTATAAPGATAEPIPTIEPKTSLSFKDASNGSGDDKIIATTGGAANLVKHDKSFRNYLTETDTNPDPSPKTFSSALAFRGKLPSGKQSDEQLSTLTDNNCTSVILKPQVDGKFKAYVGINAKSKAIPVYIYDNTDGEKVVEFNIAANEYKEAESTGEKGNEQINGADGKRVFKIGGVEDTYNKKYVTYSGGAIDQNTREINLKGGHVYIFNLAGSTGQLLRMEFEPDGGGVEPGPGGQTDEVTAEGYSKSFASTNKNFVDWTFHTEVVKPTYKKDELNSAVYRTSKGLEADLPTITFYNQTAAVDSVGNTELNNEDVANDTFDLPHKTHTAHGGEKRYVIKTTDKVRSLTITGALPNETFNSYDLIIVYNNSGSSSTTFTISQDGTEDSLKTYEDKGDNLKTTDPDEVIFRNVNVNDVKLTWTQEIDIYSVSLDYHKQSLTDVKEGLQLKNGEGANYVSGKYYKTEDVEKGTPIGVIRFFQNYSGEADGYGFVFIDQEADIKNDKIKNGRIVQSNDGENALSGVGFYGDVYDIASGNFGDTVIAMPYVSVDGYIIFAETSITGKVGDNPDEVENEWDQSPAAE